MLIDNHTADYFLGKISCIHVYSRFLKIGYVLNIRKLKNCVMAIRNFYYISQQKLI